MTELEHLRHGSHLKSRVLLQGYTQTPMGEASGVLEDRRTIFPDEDDTAELAAVGAFIEPRGEGADFHFRRI